VAREENRWPPLFTGVFEGAGPDTRPLPLPPAQGITVKLEYVLSSSDIQVIEDSFDVRLLRPSIRRDYSGVHGRHCFGVVTAPK
jgi:hypothetical protein